MNTIVVEVQWSEEARMGQLHVLLGDPFLVDKKIQEIAEQVGTDEFNSVVYDAEEFELSTMIADAQTIPFMADDKLVIMKHVAFEETDLLGDFYALIDSIPPFLTLIVVPKAIDKRSKLYKRMSAAGEIHDFEKMSGDQLKESIMNFLDRRQVKIQPRALDSLLVRVEGDAQKVMNELQKFDNYFSAGDTIQEQDIDMLVARNVEHDVFQLINAVVDKNKQQALEQLADLLQTEDAVRLLTLIQNKFREMNYTKQLLQRGFKKEDLMRIFNASKGRVYYMEKNAQTLSEDELSHQLDVLAQTEYQIKKGLLDKQVALELYILNL
jgi:DNA polymerase-3 subunit delta